jgi:hypothetical protein
MLAKKSTALPAPRGESGWEAKWAGASLVVIVDIRAMGNEYGDVVYRGFRYLV